MTPEEPTPEDDAMAISQILDELRELDRETLGELSAELTMGSARIGMAHPTKAAAMLGFARILYVIAHETPKAKT